MELRYWITNTCIAVALSASMSAWSASDGTLDASFGVNGKRTVDFEPVLGSLDWLNAVKVTPGGKIYLVGKTTTGNLLTTEGNLAIARLNPDGSVDSTYGSDGRKVILPPPNSGFLALPASDMQSDGRLIIAIKELSPLMPLMVCRVNADGSLDQQFGGQPENPGWRKIYVDTSNVRTFVQKDNKIIIISDFLDDNSKYRVVVKRLNPNGTMDANFGSNGVIQIFPNHPYGFRINDITQAPDGNIVLVGRVKTELPGNDNMFVARLLQADGSPDPGFQGVGYTQIDVGLDGPNQGSDEAKAVEVLGDGSIIVAGQAELEQFTTHFLVVAKLNADGSVANSFGPEADGISVPTLDVARSIGVDIGIQSDGKIVVATDVLRSGDDAADFAVVRFRPDGHLDLTFGPGGMSHIPFDLVEGDSADRPYSLVFSGGQVIIAGPVEAFGQPNNHDFGVAKLTSDLIFANSFGQVADD